MLKDEIKNQTAKYKEMNRKDKWNYFWTYYKIPLAITICVLLTIIGIAHTVLTNKETALYVMVIGGYSALDDESFSTLFQQHLPIDPSKEEIVHDFSVSLHEEDTMSLGMDRLTTLYLTDTIDILLIADHRVPTLSDLFYSDLRTILSAEILEQQADNLYYYDKDPSIPIGIWIPYEQLQDVFLCTQEAERFLLVIPETDVPNPLVESYYLFLEQLPKND